MNGFGKGCALVIVLWWRREAVCTCKIGLYDVGVDEGWCFGCVSLFMECYCSELNFHDFPDWTFIDDGGGWCC